MTTSDYLESLQDDLSRTVTALNLEEGTNFTDIATMAENGDISTGGGDLSEYFNDTVNTDYVSGAIPNWILSIKKLAPFSLTGRSVSAGYLFYNFMGEEIDLSELNTSLVSDFSNMFYNCKNLIKLDLSNLDTRNATNMSNMFYGALNTINGIIIFGNNFNTNNVTNMSYMFSSMGLSWARTTLDLSQVTNFNTNNVTNMNNMFQSNSMNIILPQNINVSKVTNMNYMFQSVLMEVIDLSTWSETTALTNVREMFASCSHTTKIDIRNFVFSNVSNYTNMFGSTASSGVPDNCLIIVKDQTAKDWITSKFSRLTNVQTVAEYEAS